MAVDWNDPNVWAAAYRIRIRDRAHPQFGQYVGYSRLGMARLLDPYTDTLDLYIQRCANLTRDFPIQAADRILIVGCAFGFLIEAFKDAGFPNCWGIESSTDIESRKATEVRGDVVYLNADIRGGGQVRSQLNQLTGSSRFTWVITEDVATSYTDQECVVLGNACEGVLEQSVPRTNVIHMVSAAPLSPPFTSHTLEEWKAIIPTHSWVSIRLTEWRVL